MTFLLELLLVGFLLVCESTAQCPFGCSCTNIRLTCSGNGLTVVPNFPNDTRQTAIEINLGGNSITAIRPTDFQGFVNLGRLDLTNNNISNIEEGSFSSNAQLSTLDLSNNILSEIPDNLFGNSRVVQLVLAGNQIESLSAQTFAGLETGAVIELQNNRLRTISQEAFSSVLDLHDLNLNGNPLVCDCNLQWFPVFRDLSITATSSLIGTCDSPANLMGTQLRQVSEDQLICGCTPSCVNGTCNMTVGECECDEGYTGEICDTSCPAGMFGDGCRQTCDCQPGREFFPCDYVDGTCNCYPGYTGLMCQLECEDGFYGRDCAEMCECMNGGVCHPVTGACTCTAGWTGTICQTPAATTEPGTPTIAGSSSDFPLYASIIIAAIGAVLSVLIIA